MDESFQLLETSIEEVLNLSNGIWACPGGDAKQYKTEETDFRCMVCWKTL